MPARVPNSALLQTSRPLVERCVQKVMPANVPNSALQTSRPRRRLGSPLLRGRLGGALLRGLLRKSVLAGRGGRGAGACGGAGKGYAVGICGRAGIGGAIAGGTAIRAVVAERMAVALLRLLPKLLLLLLLVAVETFPVAFLLVLALPPPAPAMEVVVVLVLVLLVVVMPAAATQSFSHSPRSSTEKALKCRKHCGVVVTLLRRMPLEPSITNFLKPCRVRTMPPL
mmetsp:Transcript_86570/g.245493  ORF Transcript_86570/g.245493 Transcript_86570/m.245493 type:complete len:226 (-) Transcript_86570:170-847(-)